jgi:hypothetical protein
MTSLWLSLLRCMSLEITLCVMRSPGPLEKPHVALPDYNSCKGINRASTNCQIFEWLNNHTSSPFCVLPLRPYMYGAQECHPCCVSSKCWPQKPWEIINYDFIKPLIFWDNLLCRVGNECSHPWADSRKH